jgi:hypothetical protein
MAMEKTEVKGVSSQIFDCDSVSISPGTKNHARLPRGLEKVEFHVWWMVAAAWLVGIIMGIGIGKFIL